MSKYVLDSNTFIEASRRYYSFNFAKTFWAGLVNYAEQDIICSIDKVFEEVITGDDELTTWAQNDFMGYFVSTQSAHILSAYEEIVRWASSQTQYSQSAKDEFMENENADAWIIAYAKANNCILVTHERYDEFIQKKIPIPNVCRKNNIEYCDTFEMLKRLNFSF